MSERLKVRMAVDANGKVVSRELMLDGIKIAELSYVDLLCFIMQAVSSLRWEQRKD